MEEKTVDISSNDVSIYLEQLRNMLIESERVAGVLDAGITDKEYLLEDLTDLLESRIDKINRYISYEHSDTLKDDISQAQIKELLANTKTSAILEEMAEEVTDSSSFSAVPHNSSYYAEDEPDSETPDAEMGEISIQDEIYHMLMQGYTEDEIARELNISLEKIIQTMALYS